MFVFSGAISASYCCKYALLPNFVGLFSFSVWDEAEIYIDSKKRLNVFGAAYGLIIFIVSLAIGFLVSNLSHNSKYLDILGILSKDKFICFLILISASLSGIFAMRIHTAALERWTKKRSPSL